jgi:tetratricopeptide (TPR) repeat protein
MPGAAFAAALLWGLHPLLTSAVAYIAQRAESLVSMFMLAALSCSARRRSVACVVAGLAAVCCKEVAVVLPLLVLLYDRCFGAGSVRRALAERPFMYAGLGASWIALGLLVARGARTASVALEMGGLNPLNYALSQPHAVLHYLRLLVWPDPLVLDYGWPIVPVDTWADVARAAPAFAPSLLVVLTLAALSLWLLARNHPCGFAGAWFFLLLAPSSSVLPIATEIMAEHRVYLASLAPVTLLVLGARSLARRVLAARAPLVLGALAAVLALLMAALVDAQNQLYRSDMLLWSHNLLATPDNPRVLLNLGRVLRARGQVGPALVLFERAAAAARACRRPRQPFLPEILDSSAEAWERAGELERANQLRAEAWELDRSHGERAAALAAGLRKAGHAAEALAALQRGVQRAPDDPQLRAALMTALLEAGELDQARAQLHALAPPSQWPLLDHQLRELAERAGATR